MNFCLFTFKCVASNAEWTARVISSFTDSKLGVSLSALKNIVSHWQGVGWVIRTIEQVDQKKQGTRQEEIDPDTDVQASVSIHSRHERSSRLTTKHLPILQASDTVPARPVRCLGSVRRGTLRLIFITPSVP